MGKMELSKIAEEFEIINAETHLFYNIETGEFDFYNENMCIEEADIEKFEDENWISAPQQRDIGEYSMMVNFTDTVSDQRKNELLCVALEGKGAFRRFRDMVQRVGLEDQWYEFRRNAYMDVAREWCEENDIKYNDNAVKQLVVPEQTFENVNAEALDKPDKKIEVTLVTLQSHNHIVGDVERGVKVYYSGGVEVEERAPGTYWASVPHKYGPKFVSVTFSHDGEDIKKHYCDCTRDYSKPPVCRHVVATVLEIQNGIVETKLELGKTASVRMIVTEENTAKAVGSGSLDVLATPMMIALMERSACECLADCMEEGQTSVGSLINVDHISASQIGAEITASATIDFVFGRKVGFTITASDKSGDIGIGKHTRNIVDVKRFMKKVKEKKNKEGRIIPIQNF